MEINVGATLHNKYEFTLVDAKTGDVKQKTTAYNLVTNGYYNALRNNSNINFYYVHLGSGTAAPSVNDTALTAPFAQKSFSLWDGSYGWGKYASTIRCPAPNQYSISTTLTFTENEANGTIGEIGIANAVYSSSNVVLYTHARITDAEGSPITIIKSNTDRLILTITMYLTLTMPDSVIPFRGSSRTWSLYGDQNFTAGLSSNCVPPIVACALGMNNINIGAACNPIGFATTHGGMYASTYWNSFQYDFSRATTSSTISGGVRIALSSRFLAAEYNAPVTLQLRDIVTGIGNIPITSDIFPPLPLTLTKTANGTQTGFNFGVAELMDDVKVYIDDVLQDASTYTWNGKDYTLYQAWETCEGQYITKCPAWIPAGPYTRARGSLLFNSSMGLAGDGGTTNQHIEYDFGEVKSFNRAWRHANGSEFNKWQYSLDGQNWTTLVIPVSSDKIYDFPTPVQARYLKFPNIANWEASWGSAYQPPSTNDCCLLCCFSNQLEFNTAPPQGSVVKIEAKSTYPLKNSNWIVDQLVIDLSISRGS